MAITPQITPASNGPRELQRIDWNLGALEVVQDTVPSNPTVLIYGAPKTGKTEAMAKLANQFKLIWIDLENSREILAKLSPEAQRNISYVRIPDTRENPAAINTFLLLLTKTNLNICTLHGAVECPMCKQAGRTFYPPLTLNGLPSDTIVVLDSLTKLSESAMFYAIKGKPIDYKLQLDDWLYMRNLLETVLGIIEQGPFKFCTSAHEMEGEMPDGSIRLMPNVGSSKHMPKIGGKFGNVAHITKVNGKHVARSSTKTPGNLVIGSRSDVALEEAGEKYDLCAFFK